MRSELPHGALIADAGALDRLAGGNLRLLSLGVAYRAFRERVRRAVATRRNSTSRSCDRAGLLALALDSSAPSPPANCASGSGSSCPARCRCAAFGDPRCRGSARQALGVETIGRLKNSSAVWSMSRIATDFQFQPVLLEVLLRGVADAGHVGALAARASRPCSFSPRPRACRFELARQQRVQIGGVERAPAERGGRHGDGVLRRADAGRKLGFHVGRESGRG